MTATEGWLVDSRFEASGHVLPPVCFGAGDGNRTHVRSLGSFYTAIVRRPLGGLDFSIIHNPAKAGTEAREQHSPRIPLARVG